MQKKYNEKEQGFQSHLQKLTEQIKYLQNQKCELEETVETFLKEKQIQVFHNGVYSNKIRAVYEDLLCLGLSTRKIESAIRIVLKGLVGIDIGRLPKETFAKYMLLETRGLAQIQVLSELAGENFEETEGENVRKASDFYTLNTLHSDGTSKEGHSFMTYDIAKKKKKKFILQNVLYIF